MSDLHHPECPERAFSANDCLCHFLDDIDELRAETERLTAILDERLPNWRTYPMRRDET